MSSPVVDTAGTSPQKSSLETLCQAWETGINALRHMLRAPNEDSWTIYAQFRLEGSAVTICRIMAGNSPSPWGGLLLDPQRLAATLPNPQDYEDILCTMASFARKTFPMPGQFTEEDWRTYTTIVMRYRNGQSAEALSLLRLLEERYPRLGWVTRARYASKTRIPAEARV